MANNLQKFIDEKIKEFEEKFKCIQDDCAGGGHTYPTESEPGGGRCQFCAEYLFPIESFLTQTIQDAAKATADAVRRGGKLECLLSAYEELLELRGMLCDIRGRFELDKEKLSSYWGAKKPEWEKVLASIEAKEKEWFKK